LIGRAGRVTAALGAVALVVTAANVGHSGGELVYRHGAASAYAPATGNSVAGRNADRNSTAGDADANTTSAASRVEVDGNANR
jgi:hypothetical protein